MGKKTAMMMMIKLNWLLFRFGFRFVFLVDSSAIINVRYEPSIDGKHGGEESKDTMQSPPLKRNKSGSTAECNDADRMDASPASLVVSFPLCSFRIFSCKTKVTITLLSTQKVALSC